MADSRSPRELVEEVMLLTTPDRWSSPLPLVHQTYTGEIRDLPEADQRTIVLAHNLMPHLLRLWAAASDEVLHHPSDLSFATVSALKALDAAATKELQDA